MQFTERFPNVYLHRRIVKAKLFIDGRYHQNIDLDDIAGESYFSKFHFIRLFKRTYGKTPHQYLTHIRITNAQALLKNGKPVNEVCYAVGFDSISSFSALFKRLSGQSPSVFQHLQLKRMANIKKAPLNYIPNCFVEQKRTD